MRDSIQRAIEDEREAIDTLPKCKDGTQQAEIRERVQKSMTHNVSIFREESALKDMLRDTREACEPCQQVFVGDRSRTFNTDLLQTLEVRSILDITEAITPGALVRNEFRGAHWHKEYQEYRDEEWLKHTMLSWNDGRPELWYKPIILEGGSKMYEPKTRSY